MRKPNTDGVYRGKPVGILLVPSDDWNYNNVSPIGLAFLQPESPGYFVSYSELELLMAEAAKRGYIPGGDAVAQAHYEAGVTASFESVGADVSGYFAEGGGGTYSAAAGLEIILTQKWIALFGQGVEAWTEWRRTKVPALTPALDGFVNEIPSRYTYPPGEQSLNKTSYDAAVAAQGADALTTKIWWNK